MADRSNAGGTACLHGWSIQKRETLLSAIPADDLIQMFGERYFFYAFRHCYLLSSNENFQEF